MYSKISRQFVCVSQSRSVVQLGKSIMSENNSLTRPLRVSIEGNIGSGKSTLINYFKKFTNIQTYEEPIPKWRDVEGHNLLGLLYEDMHKWSSTFQSYVQLTRMQIQSSTPRDGVKVQMFERSVQNNRYCFLENSYQSGFIKPAEYAVLCKWFDWIQENVDISLDLIVYLKSSPNIVYERVLSRRRNEETSVTKEYLESLHDAHEKWLSDPNLKTPVLVMDADAPLQDIIKSYTTILPTLYRVPSR